MGKRKMLLDKEIDAIGIACDTWFNDYNRNPNTLCKDMKNDIMNAVLMLLKNKLNEKDQSKTVKNKENR